MVTTEMKGSDKPVLAVDILALESKAPKQTESAESHVLHQSAELRRLIAEETVKKWCNRASIAGFVPVPFLDTLSIGSMQAMMIRELCDIFGIPFRKEIVATIISGLAGSSITSLLSSSLGGLVLKNIPLVGDALSAASQPAISYAMTHALGVVFIKHFEADGDLVDFPADKIRHVFTEKYIDLKDRIQRKFVQPVAHSEAGTDITSFQST